MRIKNRKALLDNAPIGYAYQKIIIDSNEPTVDYEFLEFNHLFEEMMGLQKEKLLNRRFSELQTDEESLKIYQKEVFKKVALHGGYETYVSFINHMKKWYKVHVFSP